MKKIFRLFSFFIAAALAAALAAPCASAAYYEPFDHPDVAYADMAYAGVDLDAVAAFCERFAQDPVGQYPALLDLYDEVYTQNELAYIRMCRNAGDGELAAACEQAESDFSYASDAIYLALSEALDGPQGDALRELMPEGEAEGFAGYEPTPADAFDASAEEAALIRQYYLLPDDRNFADAAAELYLQLAALRRDEAERAGFDSYPEYAYAYFYAREYAPEDARQLRRVVKSTLAPLYVRCLYALYEFDPAWDDEPVPDTEELLDAIGSRIGDISPELTEAFDFLRRNGLYCIGEGDALFDMGYTTALPAYRSAFLFNKVDARYSAFKDTVHEFGHFNAAYHDPTPMLYQYGNMDVSEIQSQGLELLFLPYLQEFLAGDDPDGRGAVTLAAVSDILGSVVDGCLYDEFEQAVYADPAMTVKELHALEARLNHEYGLDSISGGEPYWVYITHLFEQPCYYISYAASALPALDIWLRSSDDRDAAVDTYMKVSAARTDAWFFDVLYDNGLCDLTDRGDLTRLAQRLEQQLDPLLQSVPAAHAPIWVWGVAGAAVLLCAGLAFSRKRCRIAAERERGPCYAHNSENDGEEIE